MDCNAGKGEPIACHHTGEFISVVRDQPANANKVFELNCREKEYAPSCFSLARAYCKHLCCHLPSLYIFFLTCLFLSLTCCPVSVYLWRAVVGRGVPQDDIRAEEYYSEYASLPSHLIPIATYVVQL